MCHRRSRLESGSRAIGVRHSEQLTPASSQHLRDSLHGSTTPRSTAAGIPTFCSTTAFCKYVRPVRAVVGSSETVHNGNRSASQSTRALLCRSCVQRLREPMRHQLVRMRPTAFRNTERKDMAAVLAGMIMLVRFSPGRCSAERVRPAIVSQARRTILATPARGAAISRIWIPHRALMPLGAACTDPQLR